MDESNDDGLLGFYSSQAELLLAQYNNINQLLGPTSDWTHPGTHCELLLRDFLRTNLLDWMSVDKGYIYGRTAFSGADESHGPEVDILIHNSKDFRPIYRLNDFVIVQPESVLGIIQVKRTLNASSVEKGLEQLGNAKLHLLELNRKRRIGVARARGRPEPEGIVELDMPFIFGAVVAYEDELGGDEVKIGAKIRKEYGRHEKKIVIADGKSPAVYMLPDFIGSIKGTVLFDTRLDFIRKRYITSKSVLNRRIIGLQWLLYNLTRSIFPPGMSMPPFGFPIQEDFPEIVDVPELPEMKDEDWPIPDD